MKMLWSKDGNNFSEIKRTSKCNNKFLTIKIDEVLLVFLV